MSHNRAIVITVLFALMLLVSLGNSTSVSATAYNISVDATKIYSKQWCVIPPFLTNPLDAKIACNDDGSHCIALVYDTCVSSGVRILWSVDQFQTHVQVVGTMTGGLGSNYLDYYNNRGGELPYDVEYFADQRVFYMVYFGNVYAGFTEDLDGAGPQATLPTVYSPSAPLVTATQIYGETLSLNCAGELTVPKDWAGLGYTCSVSVTHGYKFQDGNATNLWGLQLCQARDTSPSDWDGILCEFTYDVTNTTADREQFVSLDLTVSCSAGGNFGVDNLTAQAFWTGSDWKYNIEGKVDYCTGTVDVTINEDTLASPQDWWNQHYFGGNLYWKNFSAPYVNGSILKASTTDFVSYGSTSSVYTEDGSINESINQSDADVAGSSTMYIWERNSATDIANDGIWIYREANYEIFVQSDVGYEVTANLYCNGTGSDYYDSGSGDWFTLNTPCQTGNRIIFTGQNRPSTHIEWFDIDSSCLADGFSIGVKYAQTPYDYTFTVRTESNLLITGANITVVGYGLNTTDSNGQAIFELQPLSGTTLYRNNYSTCDIRMSTDGTGTTGSYTIEKPGFIEVTGTIPVPTKTTLGGYYVWAFSTTKSETMYESGMFLNVTLKAGSDVDITPCNYDVNASGPDYVAVMINGVPTVTDTATEFPVQLKMNHSSSPVNVTLNLTLSNGSSMTEYIDIAYDERLEHTFYLPFSVDGAVCSSDCDCPSGVCINQYYYGGNTPLCGTNSTCDYTVSNCQLAEYCDGLVGCFDADTSLSCTKDSNCPNSCVDADTMTWGKCGIDGLCKNVTYDCAVECNQTAGICEELRECEQGSIYVEKVYLFGQSSSPLLSGQLACTAEKVDTYTCLPSGAISKAQLDYLGVTVNDLYIYPIDWTYTTSADGLYYNFSAISIYCSDTCSVTYEVCGSDADCDSETGRCVAGAGNIENTVRNLLPVWLQFILTSLFLWTLISLIVGGVLTYIPSMISPNAQPTPQFGLAGMFVMYMIGIPMGFVDPFIGLVIVLGIGLYLAKMISSSMAGG